MSRDGRTYWWMKDAAWWRRERIVELGEEFGPAGPAVIDWLCCEAKSQNDGGQVKSGKRSVARGCFVDPETASHVLSRSVTLGLLDDFEEADGRFTCRISGWGTDQKRAQAASRKAAQRDRERTGSPAPEPNPPRRQGVTNRDTSRPVTQGHAPSQKVTLRGEERSTEEAPLPPAGGRTRDRARYEQEIRVWAQRHFPTAEPGAVQSFVSWLRTRTNPPAAITPTVVRELAVHHPAYGLVPDEAMA